jgi:hypothetical protein
MCLAGGKLTDGPDNVPDCDGIFDFSHLMNAHTKAAKIYLPVSHYSLFFRLQAFLPKTISKAYELICEETAGPDYGPGRRF